MWEKYGKKADFMAWKMLSGKTSEKEAMLIEVLREINRGKKRSYKWKPEHKAAQSLRMMGKNKGRKLGPQSETTREKKRLRAIQQHAEGRGYKMRDDKGRWLKTC